MIKNFFKIHSYNYKLSDKNFFNLKIFQIDEHHKWNSNFYKNIVFFKKNKKSKKIENLPFLPSSIFKKIDLKSIKNSQVIKKLQSSGTSGNRSNIYLNKENAFNQSQVLVKIFNDFFNQKKRMPMIIVDKPKLKNKSSLSAREAAYAGFSFLGKDHFYLFDQKNKIRLNELNKYLYKYKKSTILIFGLTSIVWSELIKKDDLNINLKNSILVHGGGWKKITEVNATKKNFKKLLNSKFKLNRSHDYYGMVEQTGSIFFECEYGLFHTSIFSDILIRDKNFKIKKNKQKGLLQTISILPSSYPGHSILTEDIGSIHGINNCKCGRGGKIFKVHGRLLKAETRGCGNVDDN